MSKEEVFALFNDDRANARHPKFDEAYLAKAEAAMADLRARMGK